MLSKEILKTVNEFAFCLLIGKIGSSFFLWKKCFVFQLFFLVFKRTLLIVLLQVRRMKVKSNNETNFVWAKMKGKGKKLQYGWVSECWLWYDIGWALKVIVNETQVLRTSPDTCWETKRKIYFLSWDPMTWEPTIIGKSKKIRLRTQAWAQAPKPSSFAEQ